MLLVDADDFLSPLELDGSVCLGGCVVAGEDTGILIGIDMGSIVVIGVPVIVESWGVVRVGVREGVFVIDTTELVVGCTSLMTSLCSL